MRKLEINRDLFDLFEGLYMSIESDYYDNIYQNIMKKGKSGWGTEKEDLDFINAIIRHFKQISNKENDYLATFFSGKVLELGCGCGNLISAFYNSQGYFFGIDHSKTAIELANQRKEESCINLEFRCGDVISLDIYEDGFFNRILDGHCIHCITGEDREIMKKNLNRKLKTGGLLFIASMTGNCPFISDDFRYDKGTHVLYHKDKAVRFIPEADYLEKEFVEYGFEVVSKEILYSDNSEEQENTLLLLRKAKDLLKKV
jgi:SAM-dependent methyltransferase